MTSGKGNEFNLHYVCTRAWSCNGNANNHADKNYTSDSNYIYVLSRANDSQVLRISVYFCELNKAK